MNQLDIQRPGKADIVLMAVAVAGVAFTAPLIAATTAPALAIAFWRCFAGSILIVPWAIRSQHSAGICVLTRRQMLDLGLAGISLAALFATWTTSLRYTSVLSAVALVATQPAWAALIARFSGTPIIGQVWVGIGISLVGIIVLTGLDFSLDPRSVFGDFLALVGAVCAAIYFSIGERARQSVSTSTYSFSTYGIAALVLLPICVATGSALAGYADWDWLMIVGLVLLSQVVGHTLFNHVLKTTSATVASLAILFEVPLAATIAAFWLGQRPSWTVIPAICLLVAGLATVTRAPRGG